MTNQEIVAKLWNLCNVLKDDGVTYHQYVTELTYLLFLKMAQETGTVARAAAGVEDVRRRRGVECAAGNEGGEQAVADAALDDGGAVIGENYRIAARFARRTGLKICPPTYLAPFNLHGLDDIPGVLPHVLIPDRAPSL